MRLLSRNWNILVYSRHSTSMAVKVSYSVAAGNAVWHLRSYWCGAPWMSSCLYWPRRMLVVVKRECNMFVHKFHYLQQWSPSATDTNSQEPPNLWQIMKSYICLLLASFKVHVVCIGYKFMCNMSGRNVIPLYFDKQKRCDISVLVDSKVVAFLCPSVYLLKVVCGCND